MGDVRELYVCPICMEPIKPEDEVVRVHQSGEEHEVHRECYEKDTNR